MSILIKNGRIITAVDDYVADLFIEGEKITLIGADLQVRADKVIDAAGKYVIPGAIDAHTHLDMPFGGSFTADDFESGTLAAAFGGTTAVVDFAIQTQGKSTLEGLDTWHAKAEGKASIDYGFHMIITDMAEQRLSEIDRLVQEGVTSFKMFMAYPGVLYADDATHYRTYKKAGEVGARISLHAENGIVIDEIIKEAIRKGQTAPCFHCSTRPTRLAAEAVYRASAIAEVAQVPLYIVHLDCEDALIEVKRAKDRGVDIIAETCPQYLLLDQAMLDVEGFEGAKYVMSPPLRDISNQRPLWNALANGDISVVATDHAPFNYQGQKELGKEVFTKIPNGLPGIENRLTLMHHYGVGQGRLSLNRWVEVCCTAPAKIFGMFPRKGTLAVGSDADVVVFDPERAEVISAANPFTHHMNVDYTAFEGREVKGFADVTISRGRLVCEGGEAVHTKAGRYIKRAQVGELLR